MKRKARELEFISQIARDGLSTFPVPDTYLKSMLENSVMKDDNFNLKCLSLTEKTYIAFNFNAFVVRLKPEIVWQSKTDKQKELIEQYCSGDISGKQFTDAIDSTLIYKSRCCGMCDGVNDICVSDMICDDHNIMGCESCYGER